MQFLFHRDQAHFADLSPELFRDAILLPVLSYHPYHADTAGDARGSVQAAASIIYTVTEQQLRFVEIDRMNSFMNDAYALLSDAEKSQFREKLPGMIGFIDEVFSNYPDCKGIFESAGVGYEVKTGLERYNAAEDWAQVKIALMELDSHG